jgi:hypothetical protein
LDASPCNKHNICFVQHHDLRLTFFKARKGHLYFVICYIRIRTPKAKHKPTKHPATRHHPSLLCSTVNVISIFNRHALGHVIDLVYSNKSRRQLEHVVSQRNDNELSILCSFLDITGNDRDLFMLVMVILCLTYGRAYISKIQSCVNLIHHIKRCWLVVMQGKD